MKRLFIIGFLFGAVTARGALVRESFEAARPLGMGGAFLALADDDNALWYNPAGLARLKGAHVNLIQSELRVDSSDTFRRIRNALFKSDYNNLVRTNLQQMAFSLRPSFATKYFAFSFFDNVSSFTDFRDLNTLNASVDVYTYNDLGLILGGGFPFSDYFSLGFSARIFQRSAIDATLDTQTLLTKIGVSSTSFQAAAYNYLKTLAGFGWGVGVNVGTLMKIPIFAKGSPDWLVSLVVENLGGTKFRPLGSKKNLPPNLPVAYHLGTAFRYTLGKTSEFNLTLDFRHLTESMAGTKKLHLGAEYRFKAFEIRLGLYELYPTMGLGLKFPPHTRLEFSTHAVELGDTGLRRSQRQYELQLVLGFNPI